MKSTTTSKEQITSTAISSTCDESVHPNKRSSSSIQLRFEVTFELAAFVVVVAAVAVVSPNSDSDMDYTQSIFVLLVLFSLRL